VPKDVDSSEEAGEPRLTGEKGKAALSFLQPDEGRKKNNGAAPARGKSCPKLVKVRKTTEKIGVDDFL